jgi:hypothetical protein
MKMTTPKQSLKSLTFTVLPKLEVNPVQERRTKTIARLEEQKLLFNDPNYSRTVRATVKNEDGTRTSVESSSVLRRGGYGLTTAPICLRSAQAGNQSSSIKESRQSLCCQKISCRSLSIP